MATTCLEPTNTPDAGAPLDAPSIDAPDAASIDAGIDAAIDAPPSCAYAVSPPAVRLAVAAPGHSLGEHVSIASGETGASPTGFVHVGGLGVLASDPTRPVPTAFVVSAPIGNLASAITTDLGTDSFALHDARSIALRRNLATGEIHVLALFVDTSDSVGGGGLRGAAGRMLPDASPYPMDGGAIVHFDSWICSQADCNHTSSTPITTLGRALVIGDGAASPMRYVFRWQSASTPLTLAASQLMTGTSEYGSSTAIPAQSFVEISGTSGSLVALRDSSGYVSVRDASTTSSSGAQITSLPTGAGRTAIVDVPPTMVAGHTLSHVLGYADATMNAHVGRLYCEPDCTTYENVMDIGAPAGIWFVALAPADHGHVAVLAVPVVGTTEYVDVGVLDPADGTVFGASSPYVYTLPAGRMVIDAQLTTVHDGARTFFVAAILTGAFGSSTGDEIWLAWTSLGANCL
jgi:hypothetical protein